MGKNFSLDNHIAEIGNLSLVPPNLLSKTLSVDDMLSTRSADVQMPFDMLQFSVDTHTGGYVMDNSSHMYRNFDPETSCIAMRLSHLNDSELPPEMQPIPHFNPLNAKTVYEDVALRQEAVKELYTNKPLQKEVKILLQSDAAILGRGFSGQMSPEKLVRIVSKLSGLKKYSPQSYAFKKLVNWADTMSDQSVYREVFSEKERVTQNRFFAFFSEGSDAIRYGVLKPGIRPENVFDILGHELTTSEEKINRPGERTQHVFHPVFKYLSDTDKQKTELSLTKGTLDLNLLNHISAVYAALPVLLSFAQLNHYYQGAVFSEFLERQGLPQVVPTVTTDTHVLNVEDMYPVRLLLDTTNYTSFASLATNNFSFSQNHKVIQVEGANQRGKSEAWRSIHLARVLTNAGYALPASSAKMSFRENSHFISCKGKSRNGGSELFWSAQDIVNRLTYISEHDDVILDELGDATNGPTAREFAKRLLPPLIKKGCRVYVTTHNDQVSSYIRNELPSLSLTPGEGKDAFVLTKRTAEVNYHPGESLDKMKFTVDEIQSRLNYDRSIHSQKWRGNGNGYTHDLPF
jgi:hypothetical protein